MRSRRAKGTVGKKAIATVRHLAAAIGASTNLLENRTKCATLVVHGRELRKGLLARGIQVTLFPLALLALLLLLFHLLLMLLLWSSLLLLLWTVLLTRDKVHVTIKPV